MALEQQHQLLSTDPLPASAASTNPNSCTTCPRPGTQCEAEYNQLLNKYLGDEKLLAGNNKVRDPDIGDACGCVPVCVLCL